MKKNLVILEGIDGVGKSTLAQLIRRKMGFRSKHFGAVKTKNEGIQQYFEFIHGPNKSEDSNKNFNWVLDRFAGGEFTYSVVYRGYDGYDYLRKLESDIKDNFNPLLVLVTGDSEIIKERLNNRGEDFLKMKDFDKINDLYEEYYFMSNLPKIKVDTVQNSKYDCAETIIRKMSDYYKL